MKSLLRCALVVAIVAILNACASDPKVLTQQDPDADFSRYSTFGFVAEAGTDRTGYATLITQDFKNAVMREMTARGYHYDAESPQMVVNFFTNVETRTDVRSVPSVNPGGYYAYRAGYLGPYPTYANDVQTVDYQVGTANIDIIDAARKQMIWTGVTEGVLNRKAMENPSAAINQAVTDIFSKFPVKAATTP